MASGKETPLKAMLFDRSADSAARTRALMEKMGIKLVEWVATGSGWVGTWQKHRPRIVVVDLLLPKQDGLFVVESILKFDLDSLILFTHSYEGEIANNVEAKALSLGATAVLQKPAPDSRYQVAFERMRYLASRQVNVKVIAT